MKTICTLLVLLAVSGNIFAQSCYWQDTSKIFRQKTRYPSGIAISGRDKLVVAACRTDSFGKKGPIKVWRKRSDFMQGRKANDSFYLTGAQAVAFDAAENLYVAQTQKGDSSIMIYNDSLRLIRVIGNTAGPASWSLPRGMAFDTSRNLYIVSDDSVGPGPLFARIPNTGKLIKITNPLGSATTSVVLSGLAGPKGIALRDTTCFITLYDSNRIVRYDVRTWTREDSVTVTHPLDLATADCKVYSTGYDTDMLRVFGAPVLSDSATCDTIYKPGDSKEKQGIALDRSRNLYFSFNDSNWVVFFRGIVPRRSSGGGPSYPFVVFCITSSASLGHDTAGTWLSSDTSSVVVDSAGGLTGVSAGSALIYHIHGRIDTFGAQVYDYDTLISPIYIEGDTLNIYDSARTCLWYTRELHTGSIGYGYWTSSDESKVIMNQDGIAWPQEAGRAIVQYNKGNVCAYRTVSFLLNIEPDPNAGIIQGMDSICIGGRTTFVDTSGPGTWRSSNNSVAIIDSFGNVTAVDTGTATITYAVGNTCDSAYATHVIKVKPVPHLPAITGLTGYCTDRGIYYVGNTAMGGYWQSSDPSILSIVSVFDTFAAVSADTGGSATIMYILDYGYCTADTAILPITVHNSPNAGVMHEIPFLASDCVGSSMIFEATGADSSAGFWYVSDTSIGRISTSMSFPPSVVVRYYDTGSIDILYTNYNGYCSGHALYTAHINTAPHAGAILGRSHLCLGDTVRLSDTGAYGGTSYSWLASDVSVASINASSGLMRAVGAGTAVITYTATNSCGTDIATFPVTIDSVPNLSDIGGSVFICAGRSSSLVWSPPGIWSTTDVTIATIDSSGWYTGLSTGTATAQYVVANYCGADTAYVNIDVQAPPSPTTITGRSTLCTGDTFHVSASAGGGAWGTTVGNLTVNTTGLATAAHAGPDTVSYSLSNWCGTAVSRMPVFVNPLPSAGTISGADSICSGSTAIVSSSGLSGGSWSSSVPSIASVNVSGRVSAISVGTATITYIQATACGTDSAVHAIGVLALPNAGRITGPSSFCYGDTILLADTAHGGTWAVSTGRMAVTGGYVSAVSVGLDTVFYAVSNYCGTAIARMPVMVNPLPNAGTITGADSICAGTTTTLTTSGTTGGTWSSSLTTVATVDGAGRAYGAGAGNCWITYTQSTICGSDTTVHRLGVVPLPDAGIISGLDSVCVGDTILLADTTAGGRWSVTNSRAVVAGGRVIGITAGLDTVTYAFTNYCGTATALHRVVINTLPYAGRITGASIVCDGSSITLTDSISGGRWSVTNPLASVTATGRVSGLSPGIDTVLYTYINTCGIDIARLAITVSPLPDAGSLSGPSIVCNTNTVTVSPTVGSGVWSMANTHASVDSGRVTGISPGPDTLLYVFNNYCGSDTATFPFVVQPYVNPLLAISVTADSLCSGIPVTFTTTPTHGGSAPIFRWRRFGTIIDSGASFTYTPTLADRITCEMTSSEDCPYPPRITSNEITMLVLPSVTPTVSIIAIPADSVAYPGQMVNFYASPTYGGSGITYQWYVNNSPVTGATSNAFNTNVYHNDTVWCAITSNAPCATDSVATSNAIVIQADYLGLNNINNQNADIKIIPNPNHGEFIVACEGLQNGAYELDVMDALGIRRYHSTANCHSGSLNAQLLLNEQLAAGNYWLVLRGTGGQVVRMFLVR